jgi:hypothetical protein
LLAMTNAEIPLEDYAKKVDKLLGQV